MEERTTMVTDFFGESKKRFRGRNGGCPFVGYHEEKLLEQRKGVSSQR